MFNWQVPAHKKTLYVVASRPFGDMSMNKKKDKEKDKTKGSRRLFGRKAPKPRQDQPLPKRPTLSLQQPSVAPSPMPSFGAGEGFVSQPFRTPDCASPRNFRSNRASILLTADEFDALGHNTQGFSPSVSRFPTNQLNHTIPQTRKRDLSVVASDMSSTTRMDSQKVIPQN